MRKHQQLSVRERVDAALVLLRRDNPRAQITVSELCRVAGVSRANIYASHKDVVEREPLKTPLLNPEPFTPVLTAT